MAIADAGSSSQRAFRPRRLRLDLTTPTLLGLPLAWLGVFFLVPIAIVAAYSFDVYSLDPGPHGFTLTAWHDFLHSSVYLKLFWKSVKLSLIVSAIIVLLAYPLAYYLALSGTKRKYILLLLLIAPFLTSYLLRVLAWKVILGNQGAVNTFLFWTGLRSPDHPLSQLLYSRFAVMLVLGYVWLPFVALPIFVSLESLDRRLLEAATDLGASRLQAFRRVTLPLSLPGVVAAFLFVFIPTLGEFVTPSLVGGANGYMYGNQFLTNADLRGALETSAIIAALSSVGAVVLGVLASIALTRRRFRGRAAVSALLLSPLVIPYVVFGISLLLLFHQLGVPRSLLTVVIGHIVISLPYTILVLVPRLDQIDVSLEEAAFDLGASRLRTFRSITLPLILPAVVSAFLIAFTTSFDEYAVASFVVGTRVTFPIYLYSALRFPNQLPQVIAVAVVVMVLSLVVVVAAEVGRPIAGRGVRSVEGSG